MGDYRAIAGVSNTLRQLLEDRMDIPTVHSITIASPDVDIGDVEGCRLNLFLYHISENAFLKNQDLPGQGNPGAYGHPPLSLDLHFILTAYPAAETAIYADLDAQYVLGEAMRVLHEYARVPNHLLDMSLRNEFEALNVSLEPAATEDFVKIWTALPEGKFRLSVAYQVSVVQIESLQPRHYPRLVGEPAAAGPRVYALPMQRPVIRELSVIRFDDAERREWPFPVARTGDILVIKGWNLSAQAQRAVLDRLQIPLEPGSRERIELEIPDDLLPDGGTIPDDQRLQPGPRPVQIVQDLRMGEPPEPHLGVSSNQAVFMLVPRIDAIDTTLPGTITVTGTRLFHDALECMTIIGDTVVAAAHYTAAGGTEISFALPAGLAAGDHLLRVRVNSAESIDNVGISI